MKQTGKIKYKKHKTYREKFLGELNLRQKIALSQFIVNKTYREIGEYLGVTPERARQIVHKAVTIFYFSKRKELYEN